MTEQEIQSWGVICHKPITEGPYAGTVMAIMRQLYTWGLVAGMTKFSYKTRYCYTSLDDCFLAFAQWNGIGDPPGPWIKQKPQDRLGPGSREPVLEEAK